ncbi:hypothetical protein PS2_039843 [Malus domestica]
MGFRRCLFVSNMCYILSKLLLFHLVVVSSSVSSLQQSCHDEERSALLQFKESFIINRSASDLDDAYPKTSQWKLAEGRNGNCCAWDGIVCDGRTGHVIGLDLSSSCLLGSINSNSSLFQLVQLQALNLADNNFNYSRIPTSIRNFPRLVYLNLSMSVFSGQIPSQISQLAKLSSLDLSWNQLNGPIPFLGNLTHLTVLNLSFNHGFLPETHTNTSSLRLIDVSHNQLRGQLPRSLGNCIRLEFIDLSYNKFSDVFPFWLGALPELKLLAMQSNAFYGPIEEPDQDNVEYFPELRILDLSFNSFRGKFPSQNMFSGNVMRGVTRNQSTYMKVDTTIDTPSLQLIFYEFYSITITSKSVERYYTKIQEAFAVIDISSNKFEGRIPEFIGNLEGLVSFNISGNLLTGPIPSSFGNLRRLESLDLSHNKLSGQIPQSLTQLTFLAVFIVSNNSLTGPIPHGTQLTSFNSSSYEGNPGLCGDPLPKKCGDPKAPHLSPSKTEENDSGSFEFDWKFVLAGLGSGLVVGVVLSDVVITKKHEWFVEIVKTIKLMIGTS